MGAFGEKERDMLITIIANVKNICKKQDIILSQLEDKVSKGVWMWVTGGLCVLFMTLIFGCYTYTNHINNRITDCIVKIEMHETTK